MDLEKKSLSARSESILGADRRSETDEQYRAKMTETDKRRETAATSVQEEDQKRKAERVRSPGRNKARTHVSNSFS